MSFCLSQVRHYLPMSNALTLMAPVGSAVRERTYAVHPDSRRKLRNSSTCKISFDSSSGTWVTSTGVPARDTRDSRGPGTSNGLRGQPILYHPTDGWRWDDFPVLLPPSGSYAHDSRSTVGWSVLQSACQTRWRTRDAMKEARWVLDAISSPSSWRPHRFFFHNS